VAVETPVLAQPGGLDQGLQFRMAEGISVGFAPVAAPADGPSLRIQHHRRHRHLAPLGRRRRPPQQPLHPQFQAAVCEGGQ